MKMIKKILAVVLTLAMMLTIAPTITPVKAGDSMSFIDIINGVNKGDMTVNSGKTISISMTDLNNKIPGFKMRYQNKEAGVYWGVSSSSYGGHEIADLKADYSSDQLTVSVPYKYKDKYITLFVDDPNMTNYQGETFKIVGMTIHVDEGPEFGTIYETNSFLKKNFTVNVSGAFRYRLNDESKVYTSYNKTVRLYRNGSLVGTQKTSEYSVTFNNVPVSYGKNDTFKAVMYLEIDGIIIESIYITKTFYSTSAKVPNIKAYATKISKKKAYVRWQEVTGVSGYYVYMGKKKVKTVGAKTTRCMISKKKAGKSKFKVIPFVKVGKAIYKSTSNQAKPSKNQAKWIRSTNINAYSYATCPFVVTKITLSGKTYKVTGYAVNNRIFKMKKYRRLIVGLKVDGKKAFYKVFKNKKINAKDSRAKKITLKIKGKAGKDLAHGTVSLTVGQEPVWDI